MPREEFYLATPVVNARAMKAKGLLHMNVTEYCDEFCVVEKWGWEEGMDFRGTPRGLDGVFREKGRSRYFFAGRRKGGEREGPKERTRLHSSGMGRSGRQRSWMSVWVEDVDAVHKNALRRAEMSDVYAA